MTTKGPHLILHVDVGGLGSMWPSYPQVVVKELNASLTSKFESPRSNTKSPT